MKLHWFNPENDLALAHGSANFTPPKSVQVFAKALQALPLWYANSGDAVLAPDVDPKWWEEKVDSRHAAAVRQIWEGSGMLRPYIPAPWGWSSYAEAKFRRLGIEGPYPDVSRIRELSHRRTALKLWQMLKLPYPLPPEPIEATDLKQIPMDKPVILKAPWSCSGRGVTTNLAAAEGIIRRQGSVMVEPLLDRIKDFAMLFEANDGKVDFLGLSLFQNSGTSYTGNIVGPQAELRRMLGCDFIDETAHEVARCMEVILGKDYNGPFGVDMMIYRGSEGREQICPTIEVNLRRTMGFVALSLAEKFGSGELRIIPRPKGTVEGIDLVPPNPDFAVKFIPKSTDI